MKNLFLGLMLIACVSISAQELGLRFGNVPVTGQSNNVAIDGIFSLGEFSRVHADVSFGDGVGIDLLWDFIYQPLGDEALHWYAGLGPYTLIGDKFRLGAAGEIGLEYRFKDSPLVIGADWRPSLRVINYVGLRMNTFGFNARWRF